MPALNLTEWWNRHRPFTRRERDYLAGVVDEERRPTRHVAPPRKPKTMRVSIRIEIERGKGNLLLHCEVAMREFARFCDEADEISKIDPDAIVYLYPEPEDGIKQDRIGVPLARLIRIERDDGEVVYAPGDRFHTQEPSDE